MTHDLEKLFNKKVSACRSLSGFLELCTFADGQKVVIKESTHAALEAKMLRHLSAYIDTAEVFYGDETHLVMAYIEGGTCDETAFAQKLAAMHAVRFESFGFDYDTTIGPYIQPNAPMDSWITFFKNRRLLYMGQKCLEEGSLSPEMLERLERFCEKLGDYIPEPPHASLLHGDLWGGNVLGQDGETVLIDPAIYHGSYEMEIAFTTLFSTFGKRFYETYTHYLPLDKAFFDTRIDVLNLYPLLVHIRSFGGSYVYSFDRTLKRFGF